jgi:hypothetical protein
VPISIVKGLIEAEVDVLDLIVEVEPQEGIRDCHPINVLQTALIKDREKLRDITVRPHIHRVQPKPSLHGEHGRQKGGEGGIKFLFNLACVELGLIGKYPPYVRHIEWSSLYRSSFADRLQHHVAFNGTVSKLWIRGCHPVCLRAVPFKKHGILWKCIFDNKLVSSAPIANLEPLISCGCKHHELNEGDDPRLFGC